MRVPGVFDYLELLPSRAGGAIARRISFDREGIRISPRREKIG
jgi:hypothetical protein